MNKRSLIILGPQGSGKGTQALLLAQHLKVPKFSMGDTLRTVAASATPLGERIKPILKQGNLISLEDTKAVIAEGIRQLNPTKGIVIEGVPRSLEQVEPIEQTLAEYGLAKPWLIELKISDQTAMERVGKRTICSACQHPAGQRDTKCVRCGSKLIRRTDEDEGTLSNRLAVYHRETEPVIEHFKRLGRHSEINGEPPVEQVYEAILRSIER
ncbi:nucleoside monophosphate kinase [Candidatus Berkelbacteria bacterium]|nr:nucleoside monophosphate kinase [Candidatus Berkelbacteria bacterium]